MNFGSIKYVYFLGIGGIGMSALARFFKKAGKLVSGYDKTRTQLTSELEHENMSIHYSIDVSLIPQEVLHPSSKNEVLIVWTPAIPDDHAELLYFSENGYTIMKRAQVLGLIAAHTKTIAVGGTHGKTTTTTLTAHLLNSTGVDCSAFMGGISLNYNTNLLLSENLNSNTTELKNALVVVEADEYDRSFLWLNPFIAIITSVDSDHLDIYGTREAMLDAYRKFIQGIKDEGRLITKKSVIDALGLEKNERIITYSITDENADAKGFNISVRNGYYYFDYSFKGNVIRNIRVGLPGRHNVENAVAAVTAAISAGADSDKMADALSSFKGVKRRFEYIVRNENVIYIDDYGHHPAEIKTAILSAKELFQGKTIKGIFQPHLFSRTKDFYQQFAESLESLDEVVLMDIYPARELPLEGVTSGLIIENISGTPATWCKSEKEVLSEVEKGNYDVLMTMGAGDIDRLVEPIRMILEKKGGRG
ncbi:MAG: UDP-N-acetylmuramate--L-alanine ligase [Bacteroidia bacterium]